MKKAEAASKVPKKTFLEISVHFFCLFFCFFDWSQSTQIHLQPQQVRPCRGYKWIARLLTQACVVVGQQITASTVNDI